MRKSKQPREKHVQSALAKFYEGMIDADAMHTLARSTFRFDTNVREPFLTSFCNGLNVKDATAHLTRLFPCVEIDRDSNLQIDMKHADAAQTDTVTKSTEITQGHFMDMFIMMCYVTKQGLPSTSFMDLNDSKTRQYHYRALYPFIGLLRSVKMIPVHLDPAVAAFLENWHCSSRKCFGETCHESLKLVFRMLHFHDMITKDTFTEIVHQWLVSARCSMPYCVAPHNDEEEINFKMAWDATDPNKESSTPSTWTKNLSIKSTLCRCTQDASQHEAVNLAASEAKVSLFAESERLMTVVKVLVEKLGYQVTYYRRNKREVEWIRVAFFSFMDEKCSINSDTLVRFINRTEKMCCVHPEKKLRLEILASILVGFKNEKMEERSRPLYIPLHNREHTHSEMVSSVKARHLQTTEKADVTFKSFESFRESTEKAVLTYLKQHLEDLKMVQQLLES